MQIFGYRIPTIKAVAPVQEKFNPAVAVERAREGRENVESAVSDLRDVVSGLGRTIEKTLAANAKTTGRKRKLT